MQQTWAWLHVRRGRDVTGITVTEPFDRHHELQASRVGVQADHHVVQILALVARLAVAVDDHVELEPRAQRQILHTARALVPPLGLIHELT